MRIWLLSDLHRDVGGAPWDPVTVPVADVAVVAGDVCEGLPEAVHWAAEAIGPHMPVVMVPGNHSFYRRTHGEELDRGRAAAAAAGMHLLEDAVVTLGGVRFCGTTLWTDYALDGIERRAAAMETARRGLNDHRRITWTKQPEWRRFRPQEALGLHKASRAYLDAALGENPDGLPQVVVTHHGPAPASVAPAFAGDPLNPAFVSDLSPLIEAHRPALWLHGHVHASRDYVVGATRVVCNPKGYGSENPGFSPDLVIEVGA
ncbi:metallophosphoesterase [Methylobacterium durans]|uniref:Metallophosphoesterase n=1 Tax=Methylobacterium durans TaxID=2202825 RepID=A0A2U8WAH2_9HYPH|nr:metallophosphoesterase [Methylobacterium durans]AWN42581.1 metallophosphoesterase [Methylobacterium durans]